MHAIQPSPLLKLTLAADALVSGAVAVLQLALGAALASLLALPHGLLTESGIFLVGYAALLAYLARGAAIPRALVWLLVIGNAGWAAGCVLLIALAHPSGLGTAYLLIQAATVLVFAGLQWAGLKGSQPAQRPLQAA